MSWFFQGKQNQQSNQSKLPADFADQLLDLELEVESPDLILQTVTQLLELYSLGVEHYSSIKSDKYLVFKNKSQNLLLNPKVQALIDGQQSKQENNQKQNLETNVKYLNSLDKQQQVQQIVTIARDNQKRVQTIIQDDLRIQDTRVKQRMQQRIKDPVKYHNAIQKSNSLRQLEFDELKLVPIEPNQNHQNKSATPQKESYVDVKKMNSAEKLCKTEQDDIFIDQMDEIPIDQLPIGLRLGDISHPKSKKVREIVNRSQTLKKQKSDLNNFLPY